MTPAGGAEARRPAGGGEPDLAILIAAGYGALTERLATAMDERGIEGMRPSFGFVIRAVAAEQPTITRLAELLDVTKQSASGLADEAERAGFIERSRAGGAAQARSRLAADASPPMYHGAASALCVTRGKGRRKGARQWGRY